MTIIGYARVSTTDQNLEIQETILKQRAATSSVLRSAVAPAPAVTECCKRSSTSYNLATS
jgi:hypothetical protein